jgi:magnesium transporter
MKRFEHDWSDFKWIDIEAPSSSDLVQIAEEFHLPVHDLVASLDPENLVKCEFIGDVCFLIMRVYDVKSKHSAGTVQDLTTKLVFFIGKDYCLTLHRAEINCVTERRDKIGFENMKSHDLVERLCIQSLMSFDQPINEIEHNAALIEDRVYKLRRRNILREGYLTKRRASAFKKVLKFSTEALAKMQTHQVLPPEAFADLKDYTDRMIFYVDDAVENMTGLLNLHISLMSQKTNEASYRTNEVMRVLTLVSIFFLPLNFIAGIYGMNFENMPELHHENGYFWTLGFMLLVAVVIALWIVRKGWLKSEDLK